MKGSLPRAKREYFVVIEMFSILIVVVVTQLYAFVRTHKTVHYKRYFVFFEMDSYSVAQAGVQW